MAPRLFWGHSQTPTTPTRTGPFLLLASGKVHAISSYARGLLVRRGAPPRAVLLAPWLPGVRRRRTRPEAGNPPFVTDPDALPAPPSGNAVLFRLGGTGVPTEAAVAPI